MSSAFVLRSRWEMPLSRAELWWVIHSLLDSDDPMQWWPAVQVTAYDGSAIEATARSQLGYSLAFTLDDLRIDEPESLSFTSSGDLHGDGSVVVTSDGADLSSLHIEWRVDTTKTWMRRSRWLLRPVFVLGHHLIMRQGRRHLRTWVSAIG